MASFAPFRPVLDDPISQGLFEANVPPRLFGFQPLMAEYFIQFGLELLVKRRILHKIIPAGAIYGHIGLKCSIRSQHVINRHEIDKPKVTDS